jgi:phosphatidylserine decarboxylase
MTVVRITFDKSMKNRLDRLLQEDINFLLTNRVPRIALTHLMGWYSKLRSPLLTRFSIAVWRLFTELDLSESKQQRFDSLHDCFTRELKAGARPFDPRPEIVASPCDAIVGACGSLKGVQALQAKGMGYPLADLLGSQELAERYRDGRYVTLRLTSSMYHRFHAPHDMAVERVTYISGDTWNVNPVAVKRIERLFCRNERAVIEARLRSGTPLLIVPVAAILVASMRFRFLDVLLNLRYRGPNVIPCQAQLAKGEEMGWFEHGSTIIMVVPPELELCEGLASGKQLKAGQGLLQLAA